MQRFDDPDGEKVSECSLLLFSYISHTMLLKRNLLDVLALIIAAVDIRFYSLLEPFCCARLLSNGSLALNWKWRKLIFE